MAKAYISEYEVMPVINGFNVPTGLEPALAEQTITFIASTQSAAFNTRTRFIRVHVDAIASYKVGANPTATVDTPRLAAGSTEFFGVAPGMRIAFVTNT